MAAVAVEWAHCTTDSMAPNCLKSAILTQQASSGALKCHRERVARSSALMVDVFLTTSESGMQGCLAPRLLFQTSNAIAES